MFRGLMLRAYLGEPFRGDPGLVSQPGAAARLCGAESAALQVKITHLKFFINIQAVFRNGPGRCLNAQSDLPSAAASH